MEAAIATMSETELVDLHERARVIEAMTKAVRDSERIAYAARRVQVQCLRRLWEMGHVISPYWSPFQRFVAEMSPAAFATTLDDLEDASITALYRRGLAQNRHTKALVELDDPELTDTEYAISHSTEQVRAAASIILDEALGVGIPTTVHRAAAKVVEQLNLYGGTGISPPIGYEYHGSAMQYAAEEIVREAIRGGDLEDLYLAGHLIPALVTCNTFEGGWIRIPARKATVGQLRWMAEYRIKQGEQTVARGQALLQAAEACAKIAGDENTRLGDLP